MEVMIGILAFIVVVGYIWYAGMIGKRNQAKEALSSIDVQLQKRGELIPNILKIAKRFLDHEEKLLTEITELRTAIHKDYDKTDREAVKDHLAIAEQLSGKMGQLMVQVENYPDLKSDQTMITAMQSYNEVEAQIAAARRFYNSAVTALNNSVEIFPGSIIASMAGVQTMPFYEAPEAVTAPVSADDFLNSSAKIMLKRFFSLEQKDLRKLRPSWRGLKGASQLIFAGAPSAQVTAPDFSEFDEAANLPFHQHYQQEILPQVERFEAMRVEKLKSLRWRLGLGVIIAAFVIFIVVQLVPVFQNWGRPAVVNGIGNVSFDLLTGITFIGLITLCSWVAMPILQYRADIKQDIFPQIFDYFRKNRQGEFHYQAHSPLHIHQLEPSHIVPSYDSSHEEDYITGQYKEVAVEMMEAVLTETRGHGKNRRRVTTFKGMAIQLSMNKPFHGHTILKKDYGKIGNWFAGKFNSHGKEKVALEDPVFEKEFEVYSSDQVEARYLLSTSFMERLLKLSDLFDSTGIQAAFYDNHLLLMIGCKNDRFEVGSIFEPATFEHEIKTILREMEQLFQMIEILKLHEHTHL